MPIPELVFEYTVPEKCALPLGEIGILDRQLREIWFAPLGEGLVRCGQLAHENLIRPIVADDMVLSREQHMLRVARAQQLRADQRAARQIKWPPRFLGDEAEFLLSPLTGLQSAQIRDRQCHIARPRDTLHRVSFDYAEGRA